MNCENCCESDEEGSPGSSACEQCLHEKELLEAHKTLERLGPEVEKQMSYNSPYFKEWFDAISLIAFYEGLENNRDLK